MKIAAYVRVSTDRQVEQGISIEDQINQIKKWAEENSHEITKVYSELGVSAHEGNRPVFKTMIEDALSINRPYEAIVVYTQSRFYRNNFERIFHTRKLEKNDVKVISLSQPLPEDESTAELIKNVFGVIDEYQSKENSKNTTRCMRANAEQGYFMGAKPPYGYQSVQTDKPARNGFKKRLAIHPEEAEVVKMIFNLAQVGDTGIPFGIKKIAAYLNAQGYRKRGNLWTKNGVHGVLTNTICIGEHISFKTRASKKKQRPLEEWVTVMVPAIISKDDYEKIKQGLASRNIKKSEARASISPSLLTGLIKCKKCRRNMQVMTGKSGKYKYYRCSTKQARGIALCDCPNLPMTKIEKIVLDKLGNEIFTNERIIDALSALRDSFIKNSQSEAKRIRALECDVARMKERVSIIYEQIGEKKIDLDSTLTDHIKSQQLRIASFDQEINILKKRQGLPLKSFGERHVDAFIKVAKEHLLSSDSPYAKAYLRAIVGEINVARSHVTITGNNFDLVAAVSKWTPGTLVVGVPRHVPEWRPGQESNLRPTA